MGGLTDNVSLQSLPMPHFLADVAIDSPEGFIAGLLLVIIFALGWNSRIPY